MYKKSIGRGIILGIIVLTVAALVYLVLIKGWFDGGISLIDNFFG